MVVEKKVTSTRLNPFYGYPASVIAEWCCVSVGTAKLYKSGRRKPSKAVLKLFRLHRDQKVLSDHWEGFRVIDDKIFGQDGKPIRRVHLVLSGLLWQALSEASPTAYRELLKRASNL